MEFKLFLLSFVLENCLAQELYGASVNWRPTSNNSISISYRFIWEGRDSIASFKANCRNISSCEEKIDAKFQGGLLSPQDSRIKQKIFQGNNWLCIKGCRTAGQILTNLSELYFTEASSFAETKWESGVGTAELTFDYNDDIENIRLGFTDQNGALVNGLGEAYLNMAVRNDTNRPNISPLVNVFPVYRVPLGCDIRIRLFPFDGDGDRVTCHWQTFPYKRSPASSASLNSRSCDILFTAKSSQFKEGDVLYLHLYAEDYSDSLVEFTGASTYLSNGPFCRTPIQLRIAVGKPSSTSCQAKGPEFEREGSLTPYYKHSYEIGGLASGVTTAVAFRTGDEKDTILTSGPRYMIFKSERNITHVTIGAWKDVNDTTMKGIHQACAMAFSSDGTPGESRCAVLLFFEPDECNVSVNPCGKGGVCNNYFEHYTCTYPAFNVTEHMSQNGNCNTGMTTEKGNDGLKIGLPVGLFLLLLLIVIAVTLYLKHKWSEKMRTKDVGDETQISASAKNAFQ